jgi:hypothetical protein
LIELLKKQIEKGKERMGGLLEKRKTTLKLLLYAVNELQKGLTDGNE